MNNAIKAKNISSVTIQGNGIIRNSKGYLIARLVDDVKFDSEHLNDDDNVAMALDIIRDAMIKDGGGELGSLAHSWHCNIAMACNDAILRHEDQLDFAHQAGNDAASRVMKLLFGIEAKQV